MIKLLDGPAAGIVLDCKRSPRYLRVVESLRMATSNHRWDALGGVLLAEIFESPGMAAHRHHWDALDQLSDTPEPNETIHVYQWVKHIDAGNVHIDGVRNGRRFGEWLSLAADHYRHLGWLSEELRESFRDNATWRAWCIHQKEKTDRDSDHS